MNWSIVGYRAAWSLIGMGMLHAAFVFVLLASSLSSGDTKHQWFSAVVQPKFDTAIGFMAFGMIVGGITSLAQLPRKESAS